jgi:multidrug resistance efflux pump
MHLECISKPWQTGTRRGSTWSALRSALRSNGWVTNLLAQLGDYANVGQNIISVVDADSFWVDGYFEEINLGSIHEGDPAEIKLRATARSFVAMSAASSAASTSPTRKPTSRGLLR